MSSSIGRAIVNSTSTMNGNFTVEGTISVGTSATLIPMGQVVAPHMAWFYNLDPTNYVTLRNGPTGADVAQFFPGDPPALIPLLTTGTFYLLANTGACLVEYLVVSR